MTLCGFCYNVGLSDCCYSSGCWNRSGPAPTPEEVKKENEQVAKELYAKHTVNKLMNAPTHEGKIEVLKEAYPGVFKD